MINLDPSDYGIFAILISYFAFIELILSPNLGNILINLKISNQKILINFLFCSFFNAILIIIFTFFTYLILSINEYQHAHYLFILCFSKILLLYPTIVSSFFQKNLEFNKGIFITNFALSLSIIISYFISIKLMDFRVLVLRELLFAIISLLISLYFKKIKFNINFYNPRLIRTLLFYGYKYSLSQLPQNFFQPIINLLIGKLYGVTNLGVLTQSLYIFNSFYKLIAVFTDQILYVLFSRLKKNSINFIIINIIAIIAIVISIFIYYLYSTFIEYYLIQNFYESKWGAIIDNAIYLILLLTPMVFYSTIKSFLSSERRFFFLFVILSISISLCSFLIIYNYLFYNFNLLISYIITYSVISLIFYVYVIFKIKSFNT